MKKTPRHSWKWFFEDADGDGIINGIDCQPYNKKKQDAFVPSLTDNTRLGSPQPPFSSQNQTTPIQPKLEIFSANQSIYFGGKLRKFPWL